MKRVEKFLISVITVIGFVPLIEFCSVVIEQAIIQVDLLAVCILSALALSLGLMAILIIFESWGGRDEYSNTRLRIRVYAE